VTELSERVQAAYAGSLSREDGWAATQEAMALLDRGQIRVAEKGEAGWIVHEWVKQAVLLWFRYAEMVVHDLPPFQFYDKVPLKRDLAAQGVRVVPPGTVRYGAYLERGCVVMPGYVNVGAYVGAGTMVDTWATVGSCAQIGKNVHLSGGVGIGGVLEPLSARPVIIEDGCFIGSRAIVVEGVIVEEEGRAGRERRAHRVHAHPRRDRPPRGRVSRPGARALRRHPRHPRQTVPGGGIPHALRLDHRPA
jgi:2,3,4,5-tetrahydropyridine-2-carboxylate N-succinyltransferase